MKDCQQFRNLLQEIGADVEQTLSRFGGKEQICEKFLLKFPGDQTITQLEEAVREGDLERVERAAHTLKGLSANLGIVPLSEFCDRCVKLVREGQADSERLQDSCEKIQQEHRRVVQSIGAYADKQLLS